MHPIEVREIKRYSHRSRSLLLAVLLFSLTAPRIHALDLDLGMGAVLDVAPFGIESKELALNAALWLGTRAGFQTGLFLAQGFSFHRSETSLLVCERLWILDTRIALFGAAGIRLADYDDHVITPLFLGGTRLETGHLALLFPMIGLRLKPSDPDWELWCLAQWTP